MNAVVVTGGRVQLKVRVLRIEPCSVVLEQLEREYPGVPVVDVAGLGDELVEAVDPSPNQDGVLLGELSDRDQALAQEVVIEVILLSGILLSGVIVD